MTDLLPDHDQIVVNTKDIEYLKRKDADRDKRDLWIATALVTIAAALIAVVPYLLTR